MKIRPNLESNAVKFRDLEEFTLIKEKKQKSRYSMVLSTCLVDFTKWGLFFCLFGELCLQVTASWAFSFS